MLGLSCPNIFPNSLHRVRHDDNDVVVCGC